MADAFLSDVKVLELGDEKGEFCGKLFAGAGLRALTVPFIMTSPTPRAASTSGITMLESGALLWTSPRRRPGPFWNA
jgi:hypothetical protein